ncbi:MAG: NADAR family protein [Bacteroidota bacterium]
MKYDLNIINEKYKTEEKLNCFFFWGHQPQKDGKLGKSCLSQWWVQPFTVDGIVYKTAEHWMMAEKAKLFNDTDMFEKIIFTNSPKSAKSYGRKVKNFDDTTWKKNRYQIVREGNLHKFSQHENLKNFLLSTGSSVLVEASPYDKIWGIGLGQNTKGIEDPHTWKGLNLLGFVLMEVRDKLREND